MRRILAALLVVTLLLALSAPAAHAGSRSTDIALGLAAFAVYNQVVAPMLRPTRSYHRHEVVHHTYTVLTPAQVVYVTPTPVVYAVPAPVVVAPVAPPAPAAQPTMVQYPHGRYELRLQGQQYVWVWIPTIPPVPPPPPAPTVPAP